MRILSLIVAFAIAASTCGAGAARVSAALDATDERACCASHKPVKSDDGKRDTQDDGCGAACLMVCCRTVTAPADSVATPLDQPLLATRLNLPPLHADDLREPQSIFHPPRA